MSPRMPILRAVLLLAGSMGAASCNQAPPRRPLPPAPLLAYLGEDGAIRVVRADGSDDRVLAGNLEARGPLVWSPDGSSILFLRDGEHGTEIWSVGGDGSNPRALIRLDEGGCRAPRYSPDGERIAFMGDRPPGLWVASADGAELRRLSELGFPDERPAWSPDGTQIAFAHLGRDAEGRFRMQLVVAESDGSDERNLMAGDLGVGDSPFFSANGRWIYFKGVRNESTDICMLDPQQGVDMNLTNSPAREEYPVGSPDGSFIAYIGVERESCQLVVRAADGSDPRVLATFAGESDFPSWSSDGRTLAFVVRGPGKTPSRILTISSFGGDTPREIAAGSHPVFRPRVLPPLRPLRPGEVGSTGTGG